MDDLGVPPHLWKPPKCHAAQAARPRTPTGVQPPRRKLVVLLGAYDITICRTYFKAIVASKRGSQNMIIAYHSHSNYEQLYILYIYIYIYAWHDLVPIHTGYQKRNETNVYAAARWQLLLNVTALQTTPCLLCKPYVLPLKV